MEKFNLHIQDLTWGYNGNALLNHAFSTQIQLGDFVALLGANGTGKSTLLRVIGAIEKPLSGSIFSSISSGVHPSECAFVFAQRPLIPYLTVEKLVYLGTESFLKQLDKDPREIQSILQKMKMEGYEKRYVDTLSDGEFQKVMIARALLQKKHILILDEPTAFLDYPSKKMLFELLQNVAREEQKIIIMSTHEPELAYQYANKFWEIEKGELQERKKGE
jgi:iron complex transport system ATP-binding protein